MKRAKMAAEVILAVLLAMAAPAVRAHEAQEHSAGAGSSGVSDPSVRSASEQAAIERADADMARAAGNFWAALTAEQQAKARFPFEDEERFNWHFIPRQRKGITWNEMTAAQQALAHAFLASGLSQRGYQQAETIMSLDQVLQELEQGRGPKRITCR